MSLQRAKEIVEKLMFCYSEQRLEDIEPLLAPNSSWIPEDSGTPMAAQAVCDRLPSELTFRIRSARYSAEYLSDGVICVTGSLDTVTTRSEEENVRLRVSAVLERRDGRLLVKHLHTSVPFSWYLLDSPEYRQRIQRMVDQTGVSFSGKRYEDTLTGVLNVEGVVGAVRHLRQKHPGQANAFIVFTINNFRMVNRMYGYTVGDELLKDIARNLNTTCGEMEVCGRIHSDNFVMFYQFQDRHSLDIRMNQIKEYLLSPELQEKLLMPITFSAGIYLPEPGTDEPVKEMLNKAIIAQQTLKGQARINKFVYFSPEIYESQQRQFDVMALIPQAMRNKELKLYIQPKVDLINRKVAAGEALVRWVRPDGTIIGPGEFIPVMERDGLIIDFDFYMLDLLCATMRRWLDEGRPLLPVSINQSRLHTAEEGYLEKFCSVVDKYEIPHEYLSFELTESAFVEEIANMRRLAQCLHQLGFQLEIDDFGTGYSSLNLVSLLSADILKVDKSFLQGVDDEKNVRSRKVLQKFIEMAHETGMKVVCEGVETEGQLAVLEELHSEYAQGFYFYKPMPAEEFKERFLNDAETGGRGA